MAQVISRLKSPASRLTIPTTHGSTLSSLLITPSASRLAPRLLTHWRLQLLTSLITPHASITTPHASRLTIFAHTAPPAASHFSRRRQIIQDWAPAGWSKTPKAASAAKPAGKKARKAAEIDYATDAAECKLETVSLELRNVIMQARTAKKLTQAKLAQALNMKPADVQAYEAGKFVPDQKVLGKMSRVLGVNLKHTASSKKGAVPRVA